MNWLMIEVVIHEIPSWFENCNPHPIRLKLAKTQYIFEGCPLDADRRDKLENEYHRKHEQTGEKRILTIRIKTR